MENKDIFKTAKKRPPNPVDLDDIDLDNLTFKPITQGLGFHPEKKEIPIIKSQMSIPRPSIRPQASYVSSTLPNSIHLMSKPASSKPKVEIKVFEEAQVGLRLMSFALDMLIILTGTGITLFVLGLSSGFSLEILMSILAPKEIILFTTGVFSIYFLFYFSILDLSSTVGKSLMGLEMKKIDGKKPEIQNTFLRSFLTLLFLPLLGTPAIGEIQEKLSGTKIFKR